MLTYTFAAPVSQYLKQIRDFFKHSRDDNGTVPWCPCYVSNPADIAAGHMCFVNRIDDLPV